MVSLLWPLYLVSFRSLACYISYHHTSSKLKLMGDDYSRWQKPTICEMKCHPVVNFVPVEAVPHSSETSESNGVNQRGCDERMLELLCKT